MNAHTGAVTSNAVGAASTYSFTFGTYNQAVPWTDVRTLFWTGLTELLTRHEFGPKEGSCIVPAIFAGGRRTKHEAQRIEVVFLDSDAGAGLDEISHAIRQRGWAAVISSTYSHQSRRTVAKRSTWSKYRAAASDPDGAAAAFLMHEKHYLPRVAQGARIVDESEDHVVFEHNSCPKFRIAIPTAAVARIQLRQSRAGQRSMETMRRGTRSRLAARP